MVAVGRTKVSTGLIAGTLLLAASVNGASAAGLRYNCQNGPQLTVIFSEPTLRYVYDGPDSAMRTMRAVPGNPRLFRDGRNSITLRPNRARVEYREGQDLFDRCTAFHGF
jgi:hypothetical protein